MIEIIDEMQPIPDSAVMLLKRTAEHVLQEENAVGSVTIEIVDGEEIRRLNREFRNVDSVTDVLTFPAWEGEEIRTPKDGYLGDIAICYPRAREQAEQYGHSFERELSFLTVHGILHILGYDHMNPEEEKAMFERQEELLNQLGVKR